MDDSKITDNRTKCFTCKTFEDELKEVCLSCITVINGESILALKEKFIQLLNDITKAEERKKRIQTKNDTLITKKFNLMGEMNKVRVEKYDLLEKYSQMEGELLRWDQKIRHREERFSWLSLLTKNQIRLLKKKYNKTIAVKGNLWNWIEKDER